MAASQYFLQLAGYIGIPVISWNADNSGFERRVRIRSSYSQLSQQVPRIQMPPYFICQVWLCVLYGGPFAKIFNNWFLRPHLSNCLTGIFLAVSQVSAPGPARPQHRAPGVGHGGHPRQVRVRSHGDQDPDTLTFSLAQIQLEAVRGSDLRYRGS